jgi:hypothetical protein
MNTTSSNTTALSFKTDVERKKQQNYEKKAQYETMIVNEWILQLSASKDFVIGRVSDEMAQNHNYAILFTLTKHWEKPIYNEIDWKSTTFLQRFNDLKGYTIAEAIEAQLPPLTDVVFRVRGWYTFLQKDPYSLHGNRYDMSSLNLAHKSVTYYMIVVEWTKVQQPITIATLEGDVNDKHRKSCCNIQ